MNKIIKLKKLFQNKSSGFSYIEAIVSLLIISLVAVMIASVYSVSIKSLTNTRHKFKYSINHLKADEEIREFISSVDYPFWINEYKLDSSENSITVEYYKGIEGFTTKEFNDVKIIECDFIRTSENEPVGIYVKYILNEKEYETKSLLASFPYGAVRE